MDIQDHVQKTGTTTLAIICKDGVVIAGDKRTTAGYEVVNRNKQKVLPITDTMMVTTAGVVSEIQRLVKVIKAEIRLMELKIRRPALVQEVASLLTNIVYGNIRTPSTIMPITGFLLAGVDATGNHIFSIQPDGSIQDVPTFESDGSGSPYAISVLEDSYKKDMTIADGVELVKRALNVALLRDTASGNGYMIFSINKNGNKLEADENINTGVKLK